MKTATIEVKVCGITSEEGAEAVLICGVNYIGLNLWSGSLRYVDDSYVKRILKIIPQGKRVAVDVESTPEKLRQAKENGFDFFQIHFDLGREEAKIRSWIDVVGRDHLWLAPRISEDKILSDSVIKSVDVILQDAYDKQSYGGTGKASNWKLFKTYKTLYPDKKWILAGGLSPENIERALRETGAQRIDLNSGIEKSPGIKDIDRLKLVLNRMSHIHCKI